MVSFPNRLLATFLRWFFYLLYNHLAWTYDLVAAMVSLGQWQKWVRCVLPYLNGERILELGHGPGHLQAALQETTVRQVYGLDLSRSMGEQAKRRLKRLSLPSRLVRGKAQQLPFTDNTFDQVVSTFPAEYIFQPQTLIEIYRVLVPGGYLVVLPVAWIRPGNLVQRWLARLFIFTGQSPRRENFEWQSQRIALFSDAGFLVRTTIVDLKTSEVFLVFAAKSAIML